MPFAKLHPSFLILFFLSLLTLFGAFILAAVSTDACTGSNANSSVSARCMVEAQGESTMALVLAIGGLTAMLGGIGFQIGRARPPQPQPVSAGQPPYAVPGGQPYAPPAGSVPPASPLRPQD